VVVARALSAVVMALVTGLLLIPVLDQALKFFVLFRLGSRSVPIGPIGKLQVVQTQIWMARMPRALSLVALWTVWILAACALIVFSSLAPSCGWFAGLLVGGSLSHGIESSSRGWICDYVCLRFWPAFNIADVAITVGACGLAGHLILMTTAVG
jgi:signal peptidase II